MVTRVTENMKYSLLTRNLSSVQDRCSELMLQLSTQKRINRPSDDPAGMSTVMNYRDMLASMEQYGRNIDGCTAWLNITESTLSSVNDILVKVQETAISQASATATAATRQESAATLESLIDQVLSLANTKLGDRYIFSGTKTGTKPFEVDGSYEGNGEEMTLNIGKDRTMHYSFSGEAVFTDMGAGTVDIFGTLNELKTALAGNDVEGIRATLDDLKAAQQQVTRYQAICGTRTNDLEITKGNYEALKENITGLMSNTEDADVTKLVTDFQMKQLALQASYYMAGEIGKISILNFIK